MKCLKLRNQICFLTIHLMLQYKEVEEIEKILNNEFENIYDWFLDNKLSIHHGEDTIKSTLFAS